MESEKTVRTFIASKLPSYTAKELPMTDKDGGVTMIATVLFPNLVDIVIFFLDQLQDSSRLTWHGGAIPESEIWIKIGGDHGGGSFKLSFQIVNTEHPNSLTNIIPFCIFNGKDTPANLETALGQYRPQLQQLQQTSWKGKTMKIYLFGDYEFQTVNFGLSGSSGLRPCLHCLCTKKSMELESDAREEAEREPRTLASLASDHSQYVAAGSKLAQAKKYNNVIRPNCSACVNPERHHSSLTLGSRDLPLAVRSSAERAPNTGLGTGGKKPGTRHGWCCVQEAVRCT
eukprot:scpid36929/ scgid32253/ 